MIHRLVVISILLLLVVPIHAAAPAGAPVKAGPERPFATAERYHKDGRLEDARSWYRKVITDFPGSRLAAEGAFRCMMIDWALQCRSMSKSGGELDEANADVRQAADLLSDLRYTYIEKAKAHVSSADKYNARTEAEAGELANDFKVFKPSLGQYKGMWKIPGVPADVSTVATAITSMTDDEASICLLKAAYNARVDEIASGESKGVLLDPLRLRYMVGFVCYQCHTTTEFGASTLKEVLDSTTGDPYSKTRYDAEKALKEEPAYVGFEKLVKSVQTLPGN